MDIETVSKIIKLRVFLLNKKFNQNPNISAKFETHTQINKKCKLFYSQEEMQACRIEIVSSYKKMLNYKIIQQSLLVCKVSSHGFTDQTFYVLIRKSDNNIERILYCQVDTRSLIKLYYDHRTVAISLLRKFERDHQKAEANEREKEDILRTPFL